MDSFWATILSNAIVATFLAIGAAILGRVWKNPAAVHLLWVIVLLKFFTPPLVTVEVPFAARWMLQASNTDRPLNGLPTRSRNAIEPIAPAVEPELGDGAANDHHQPAQGKPTLPVLAHAMWSLTSFLAGIWICGTVIIAVTYALQIHHFASHVRNLGSPPERIGSLVIQTANGLGLRRAPNVLMTPRSLPPLVWSFGVSPRLILPTQLFCRLNESAQTTIIAHELVHVSRRDHLVRLLELAATTIFWWHPVVWWASWQLRELEEFCCDSRVLELVPNHSRTYATALVDTVEFLSERPRVYVPLPTAVYSTGSLSARIRMLTQPRANRLNLLSFLFVSAIVTLPLIVAFAADPDPTPDVPAEQADGRVAFLRGYVDDEAGNPLSDVRVRIAVPAMNMRQFIDISKDHKLLEAKTDERGKFHLKISGLSKRTPISIDALKPGYRKLVGTPFRGGDAPENLEVAPGAISEAKFTLKPSLYFTGMVVDETGKPIPAVEICANANSPQGSAGVERTLSNLDGSFELFNYPTEPIIVRGGISKGAVDFFHPNYVGSKINDLYTLAEDQRESLQIVLPTGRTVSGRLLDVMGKPVSNVMIKAILVDGYHRKAVMSDANGMFALKGLADGPTLLSAYALDILQKITMPLTVDSDKQGLEVHLQAITLPPNLQTYEVLGMRLTDATPELKSDFGLTHYCALRTRLVILDPGVNSDRLNIGKLAKGYKFCMAGDYQEVSTVREFIEQILASAANQSTQEYSVCVVYNYSDLGGDGSNTQHLKLTNDDIAQLKTMLNGMTPK